MTPLKQAFENSRMEDNIDVILPILLGAKLFVVGKVNRQETDSEFLLTKSPKPERFCVTVSESSDNFESIQDNMDVIQMTGEVLLKKLNPAYEIVIVYNDGGDYLTQEQLAWFRQSIPEAE